ncbi:DNA-directed RNA polymerase I subunit 2 [Tanacetum coccineum]
MLRRPQLGTYPARQANISYSGKLSVDVCFKHGDGPVTRKEFNFGEIPIMLMSNCCNLRKATATTTQQELVSFKEEPSEMGGCVREDQIRGREHLLPIGLVLKALIDTTDYEIFMSLTCVYNDKAVGCGGNQILGERANIILKEVKDLELLIHIQCLEYTGEYFKPFMFGMENDSYSVVANAVLVEFVLVHLDNKYDKFNLLIFMVQKLFSFIDKTSQPDNPDALQTQEVLPGHMVTIYVKVNYVGI